jgi:hypothetical protein
MYLDDGFLLNSDKGKCREMGEVVKRDLAELGFMFHVLPPKSFWEPRNAGIILGYQVDLPMGMFSVPDKRLAKVRDILKLMLQQKLVVSAKTVAKLAGHVQSMSLAIGPVSRLRTRHLYAFIDSLPTWQSVGVLPDLARDEFNFWVSIFEGNPSAPIWLDVTKVDAISYSDSSDYGWGGFTVAFEGSIFARGDWEVQERGPLTSSTFRELKGVLLFFHSCIYKLRGRHVIHRSDNQNVVRILYHGSRKPLLQNLAVQIFKLAVANNIVLQAEWIPREGNDLADYLSKIKDVEDYMLHPIVFDAISKLWGPFSFDRFASLVTAQVRKFSSRWFNPLAAEVDAFSVFWGGHVNWVFPPLG